MDLTETIDLDTGDHTFVIHLAAREITLISDVGKQLPKQITDSQKLSDKLVILSVAAKAVEDLEEKHNAAQEWPL